MGVAAESKILAVRAVMVVQAAAAVAVVVLEEREPQDHPAKGMTGVTEPRTGSATLAVAVAVLEKSEATVTIRTATLAVTAVSARLVTVLAQRRGSMRVVAGEQAIPVPPKAATLRRTAGVSAMHLVEVRAVSYTHLTLPTNREV